MSDLKTVLVTGASGYTGKHACEYLVKRGFHVAGVSRKKSTIIEGCTMFSCDLTDNDEVKVLIKKVQPHYVLHLAGKNNVKDSWQNPSDYIRINVMGTVNLLENIRSYAPDARIVVAGSILQNQLTEAPPHPYSLSKSLQILVAQTWERLFQLPIIIAKPCNLIGPGQSNGVCSIFGKKIVEMESGKIPSVLQVHDLKNKRDFLDVRDAVQAYLILLQNGKKGEVYEIGREDSKTLQQVAETYYSLSPAGFSIEGLTQNEAEQPFQYTDLEKMKSLGWKPSYSLTESLKDVLTYFRSNAEEEGRFDS